MKFVKISILVFMPLVCLSQYARQDVLYSAGRQYPIKGIGSIHGTDYKVKGQKWWAIFLALEAGFWDGVTEAQGFDGQANWGWKTGAHPNDPFFGQNSWETGNNTGWERQFGVFNAYHIGDDLKKNFYLWSGMKMGRAGAKYNTRKIHNVFDFVLLATASGLSKSFGMAWARDRGKWYEWPY